MGFQCANSSFISWRVLGRRLRKNVVFFGCGLVFPNIQLTPKSHFFGLARTRAVMHDNIRTAYASGTHRMLKTAELVAISTGSHHEFGRSRVSVLPRFEAKSAELYPGRKTGSGKSA
jgi:hypothetical protein